MTTRAWPLWVALVVLGGLAWLGYSKLGERAPARLVVEPAAFDFGPVSAKVETTFVLRNAGEEPLEILGISTSCGCTRAWVDQTALLPGARTALYVSFDPNAHEGIAGPVVRQVYVRTTDPERPEVTVELRATVVAPEEGL